MSSFKNQIFNNSKHWQNNLAGIFLLSVTMFTIVIAVNLHFPSEGTSSLLWLLGAIGVGSLAGWTRLAIHTGAKTAERVLFNTR